MVVNESQGLFKKILRDNTWPRHGLFHFIVGPSNVALRLFAKTQPDHCPKRFQRPQVLSSCVPCLVNFPFAQSGLKRALTAVS